MRADDSMHARTRAHRDLTTTYDVMTLRITNEAEGKSEVATRLATDSQRSFVIIII